MSDNGHLARAVASLLRPLARLLLKSGMSYKAFAELAKGVFVEVAREDFRIPGRKQSDSRVSVITGLSRKEVKRVQAEADALGENNLRLHNRAARVIHGWVSDPDFQRNRGEPDHLPMEATEQPCFVTLVRRYSGDAPPRAVLDELDRVGAIERHDDGRLSLKTREYAPPSNGSPEKMAFLGQSVAALIESVDRHWKGDSEAHFQGMVRHRIPEHCLEGFRRQARARGQENLDRVGQWLDRHADGGQETDSECEVGAVFFTYER